MSDEQPVFFMKAYLWANGLNWSEELIDELMDRFADFLVENGFGSTEEDELVNSVIVVGQEDQPDDAQEFFHNITNGKSSNTEVTCMVIPKNPEE